MHPTSLHHRPARFRLVTLGRLTLLSPTGSVDQSLGTRRRKLAVLAYLALRARPVTRDHLVALFWGGKDDTRARNSLSDAISHLRRVLGRNAIVTSGDEVALAENAAIDVDAVELRAAIEAHAWERAMDLYAGPFLDGVHVEDAAEFEHWRGVEEMRLRRLFVTACAPHTQALARSEQWDACAAAAARWLDAEPASTDGAMCRLNALRAPGTNDAIASALAEYERLRALLAENLGVGMDPAVERLATSMRGELPSTYPLPATPSRGSEPSSDETGSVAPHRTPDPIVVTPRDGNASKRTWRRGARLMIGLAGAAALVGAFRDGFHRVRAGGAPVLAIFPFENLGAADDEHFAEGLAEEIRSRVANTPGLTVIGGSSTRHYGRTTKTSRDIARELGATHLVTGSFRWERAPDGDRRVRVSPELVRVGDQANLWGTSVDGRLDDLFAIQSQVAKRVATALDATLHVRAESVVSAPVTSNLAAYDAYLRGRTAVSSTTTFSAADRRTIQAEFERAVRLDPQFAAAHVELAWSHFRDYSQAGNAHDRSEALGKFRAEARRAWELDTTRVDTRLVHARDLELRGNRAGAASVVRGTVRAAPDNVEVLSSLAHIEWYEGNYEAALAAERRAMELDPLAVNEWKDLAGDLDRLYRHEQAVKARERELEVTPNSDVAFAVQASSYLLWRADTAAARQTLERGSVALPWVVRLPSGTAGISIWAHATPSTVLRARDTLTLAGYLAGPGGIAPELYHLLKLRHLAQSGHTDGARAHAESLVVRLAPVLRDNDDTPLFFWWFSHRSILAEAYATLGRTTEAAREADVYVADARRTRSEASPEQLCHALHNAAYVDVLIGRKKVATAFLTEALSLPCGHRISRALLRADSAWAPLWNVPAFARLIARGDAL